jgi:hypothetical protein
MSTRGEDNGEGAEAGKGGEKRTSTLEGGGAVTGDSATWPKLIFGALDIYMRKFRDLDLYVNY